MVKIKSDVHTAHLSLRICTAICHFSGKSFEGTSQLYLIRYLLKLD